MKKYFFIPILILIIVNFILVFTIHNSWYVFMQENSKLEKGLYGIKADVLKSHLWLEEYLAKDTSVNLERDVLEPLGHHYIDNIINQPKNKEKYPLMYKVFEDLDMDLDTFYMHTIVRLENIKLNVSGSEADEAHDIHFATLLNKIDKTITTMQLKKAKKLKENEYTFIAILLSFLVLNIGTILLLHRFYVKHEKKHKLLLEQSKMATMGEMIENIIHQWRQPLSSITVASSSMQVKKDMGILNDDDLSKGLEDIKGSANFLSQTITDFRNFIYGEMQKSHFNVKKSIHNALLLVSSSMRDHHINVILNLEDDIKIYSLKNELIQCLINIINNAKDELKKQDTKRLLFINLTQSDESITITIKDNAGGVPKEVLPKIFEAHFTTKDKNDGTGIGLHITNMLINSMKGKISVENAKYIHEGESYQGANFILKLPKNLET